MKVPPFLSVCLIAFIAARFAPFTPAADVPSAGLAGRYGMPGNAAMYCDLRPDGTFIFALPGRTISGTYSVKGGEVTLLAKDMPPQVMKLADGALVDPDGTKWPRGADGAAPPVAPKTSGIPAGLSGRYTLEENDRFLDLRPDGTFSLSAGKTSSAGTYAVNGTEVNLTIPGATLPQFHFFNGSLTIRGVKLPRVGNAAPPPAPGAVTGPAIAPAEKVNATRSIINVKLLYNAARLWSIDHQGKFPDSLEQLLTKKYAGTDPRVLHCPLLQDDSQTGYVYLGKGLTDSAPEGTVLFLSKWHDAENKRIVGHANGSAALELPKLPDIPPSMRGPVSNPGGALPGASNKAPSTPSSANPGAATPGVSVIPPNLAKITLSANDNGKGRYGAIFPLGQMPADLNNYFWVTDRPDNKFNVTALQQNTWFVSTLPGIYKVRVEYRSGTARQQVSNLVEVTVPDTGQAPPNEPSARAAATAAIPPEQAGAHIGEVKTVEGIASSVESGNKGKIFLNFGAKSPNQVFSAFIAPRSNLALDDLKPLEGKSVRITGKIVRMNGRPQIIIENRSQIQP